MTFLNNLLIYLVAISVLVAVHEYGHFWVARRAGVKVLRFSIGFGRVLWSRPLKDGTEFAISAIPIGGYVSMLGESDDNVPTRDSARSFKNVSVAKRIAIMAAGPMANFIFAILIYWVLYVVSGPGVQPLIGDIKPGSIAASAGLRSNDVVLEVNGKKTPTQEAVVMATLLDVLDDGIVTMRVAEKNNSPREIRLDGSGSDRKLADPDALLSGLGFNFWRPVTPAKIGEIVKGDPADKAGMLVGDEIIRFDGVDVKNYVDLRRLILERPNKEVPVDVLRNGQAVALKVKLASTEQKSVTSGKLGVWPVTVELPADLILARDTLFEGLGRAIGQTWDKTVFVFKTVGYLLVAKLSLQSVSGPVGIATVAGEAARIGMLPFVSLLALISISIGALNLLPIPILDGGRIVFQLAELLKGGPVSERAQIAAQYVGIVLLVLLTVLAFYNDIARLT